jgi:hypothetical protein
MAKSTGSSNPPVRGLKLEADVEMANLKTRYREEILPQLQKELGVSNPMAIPRITKITLNMGVGGAVADRKILEHAIWMYFLSHNLLLFLRNLDRDMTGLLMDAVGPAFGSGADTLERHTFIYINLADKQLINISTRIVLGVGNRRIQGFPDMSRCFFGAERQNIQCLLHCLTPNLVGNQTRFLG